MSASSGATRPRTFRLGGYTGEAVPEVESALHTRLLPDPMAHALEGEVLRASTTRRTARVSWPGLGALLLKVHRARSLGERLLGVLRPDRARAEWEAARYLEALGAPVPAALAVGVRRQAGTRETSFYLARFLQGMRPVHEVLADQTPEQGAELHVRLARLVRALHERGFDHRDLHSGNVLAGPGPGDRCRLAVTDLHRCAWGGILSRRARVRGVAQWLHSVRADPSAPSVSTWLESYLEGPAGVDHERWIRDVQRRIDRLEAVRLRSRGKRCFKESTVYTRSVGAGWGGRRRDLPRERLESALAAHDEAVARDDERVVKRGRRGVVTRHGDVVVKERLAPDLSARVRDAILPRRHAAGYRNAHRLTVHEVGTARPLAYVRRGGRSLTLYEDLSALKRLDHLARRLYRDGAPAERDALLEASARWVGGLHARGIYHGDLKGVNVLVEKEGPRFSFHLIDTDHCRFFSGPVDRRRRVKNLAQLSASIPASVTPADRSRWYTLYAAELPDGPGSAEQTAAICQDVDTLVARKIVVVDEPIE